MSINAADKDIFLTISYQLDKQRLAHVIDRFREILFHFKIVKDFIYILHILC